MRTLRRIEHAQPPSPRELESIELEEVRTHRARELFAWWRPVATFATPVYKGILRWVRIRAVFFELFHIRYTDPFLPSTAWTHAPRF